MNDRALTILVIAGILLVAGFVRGASSEEKKCYRWNVKVIEMADRRDDQEFELSNGWEPFDVKFVPGEQFKYGRAYISARRCAFP